MKKWPFVALLLVGATILGATVLREPIGHAASPFTNVIVGSDPTKPVPVHEQGTVDVNLSRGTVPVHEQGTVDVNVSGGTVGLASPALATRHVGGDLFDCPPGDCFAETLPSRMTVSNIVLMAEGSRAEFRFKNGEGNDVYSVWVAAG